MLNRPSDKMLQQYLQVKSEQRQAEAKLQQLRQLFNKHRTTLIELKKQELLQQQPKQANKSVSFSLYAAQPSSKDVILQQFNKQMQQLVSEHCKQLSKEIAETEHVIVQCNANLNQADNSQFLGREKWMLYYESFLYLKEKLQHQQQSSEHVQQLNTEHVGNELEDNSSHEDDEDYDSVAS